LDALRTPEAMRLLAEAGFIRIDDDVGGRSRATVLLEAEAFLASE
jgi:hypothetical protein